MGVASIGEAEVFAQNGISDILIVSEIVTAPKIARYALWRVRYG